MESVGSLVIVADVEIGPAVGVEVPPDGGEPDVGSADAAGSRDFRETRSPEIPVERIPLPGDEELDPARPFLHQLEEFVVLRIEPGAPVGADPNDGARHAFLAAPGEPMIRSDAQSMGDEVGVEEAVPVVVGEREHDAGARESEAEFPRAFGEASGAVVDEHEVGGVEDGHGDVEVAVVVDVHRRGPAAPASGGLDPGRAGNILEAPLPSVEVKPIAAVELGHEDIGKLVAVEVPEADAGSGALVLHQRGGT